MSRRTLLQAGVAATAVGFATGAMAQAASRTQAEWGERFDSAARVTRMSRTSTPLLSPQTVQMTELAIQQYSDIVARGGWPMIPTGQVLKLGTRSASVVPLRQHLIASGDLQQSAGLGEVFDSYVEGAVRRFQARHGLLPVGAVGEDTLKALNVSAEARLHQLSYLACPHCSYEVKEDWLRCPSCTRKLRDPCTNCGKPLDPDWRLCPHCEADVAGASTSRRRRSRSRSGSDDAERTAVDS